MAIAYRSSTSTNTGAAGATTITVTIPAGIQIHDVLIASIAHDGGTVSTIDTPAGWTLLRNTSSAGASLRMAVFWRLVEGGEAANYTWTFDTARQACGNMSAYSGASITIPPNNASTATTTAGLSFAASGTNGSYEAGLGMQFFASRNTTAASTQTSNVAYTKREDTCTTASVFIGLTAQDQARTLPVSSTSATGNTCTVTSTGLCISLFIDEARPSFLPLAVDEYSVNNLTTSAGSLAVTGLQTNVPNVTFIALISINKTVATISSLATPGVTWAFETRVNTVAGCVELWRAFIATPMTPQTTTITFSTSVVSANVMIGGFINADFTGTNGSAAIGATASSTFTTAVPTINLVTTRNNSLVWAIMNSATSATSPVAGTAQTVIRSHTDATNTAQSVMWRQTNRTPASGTTVTLNLTTPSTGTGNILAVEILPQQLYNLGSLGTG